MRVSCLLSAVLAGSVVAKDAIDAFTRVDKVLEARNSERQKSAVPRHERLEKRASPFLNDASKSGC